MPELQEMQVQSLGQEDPLEEEMATYSSILAWRIPWTEEPGGLQSMRSQRLIHDWTTEQEHKLISSPENEFRTQTYFLIMLAFYSVKKKTLQEKSSNKMSDLLVVWICCIILLPVVQDNRRYLLQALGWTWKKKKEKKAKNWFLE